MDMKYAIIGFLRVIGGVALTAVLSYLGVAEHWTLLSPVNATIAAGLVVAFEHVIEAKTGRALFGAVRA